MATLSEKLNLKKLPFDLPFWQPDVTETSMLTVMADKVLMAVGRRAALESLNLADVGIECTRRGIQVNDVMQTNVPHIYAVGDINGKMMLAHAATFQGIVALDHIMGIENDIELSVMPAAVFTSPEAASVGLTEDECKEAGIPVKCLKSFFRANGKAVTMGETDGFCKVVVAAEPKEGAVSSYEPGRVLGCHLYGPHASDIVQEACVGIIAVLAGLVLPAVIGGIQQEARAPERTETSRGFSRSPNFLEMSAADKVLIVLLRCAWLIKSSTGRTLGLATAKRLATNSLEWTTPFGSSHSPAPV